MEGAFKNFVFFGDLAQFNHGSGLESTGVKDVRSVVIGQARKIAVFQGACPSDAFGSIPIRAFRALSQNEECLIILRYNDPQIPNPEELCRFINVFMHTNLSVLYRSQSYGIDILVGSLADIGTVRQKMSNFQKKSNWVLHFYDYVDLWGWPTPNTNSQDGNAGESYSTHLNSQFYYHSTESPQNVSSYLRPRCVSTGFLSTDAVSSPTHAHHVPQEMNIVLQAAPLSARQDSNRPHTPTNLPYHIAPSTPSQSQNPGWNMGTATPYSTPITYNQGDGTHQQYQGIQSPVSHHPQNPQYQQYSEQTHLFSNTYGSYANYGGPTTNYQ